MIVRAEPDRLVLVRQADHSALSGWLAAAWGAAPWERPTPRESVVVAARLHDLAWTPFDETLPRRPDGRPAAFHEVSRTITTRLYAAGVDAVEAIDPYAGLLNSLHFTGFYVSHWGWRPFTGVGGLEGEERSAVERFLDREDRRRRRLRDRLGLDAAREASLRCAYLWLQLWDRISIHVCGHGSAGWSHRYPSTPLSSRPGGAAASLRLELRPGGECRLDPYPLLADPFRVRLPCVSLPLAALGAGGDPDRAWATAGTEALEVTFRAGG